MRKTMELLARVDDIRIGLKELTAEFEKDEPNSLDVRDAAYGVINAARAICGEAEEDLEPLMDKLESLNRSNPAHNETLETLMGRRRIG